MRVSKAQRQLEAGEWLTGAFQPVGASFETPGIVRWTPDRGAELRLAVLTDPWPTDAESPFAIHGALHVGENVTILEARVASLAAFRRPALFTAPTLALGEHTDLDEVWPVARYCPSGLHEWYPEVAFKHGHSQEEPSRPLVEMRPVDPRIIELPDARLALELDGEWSVSFSPNWSVESSMLFAITPDAPLTIEDHSERFGDPLLGFVVFASDRPDDLRWESYRDPESRRQVVVLRAGRKSFEREWRPVPGHFLFKAQDVPDEAEAIRRWLAAWRASQPSLGLFCETIQQDTTYSAPRFLTLRTAAEGYWKATKHPGEKNWNVRALAARADVDPAVTGVDKAAERLIGALRDYHAHLKLPGNLTPIEIAHSTFDSTRRLHALMQASLLREIGLGTEQIEELIRTHYLNWPIP